MWHVERRPIVQLVRVAGEPAQRSRDEHVDQAIGTRHRDVLGRAVRNVQKVLQDVRVVGAVDERVQEIDHVRSHDVHRDRCIVVEVLPPRLGALEVRAEARRIPLADVDRELAPLSFVELAAVVELLSRWRQTRCHSESRAHGASVA